LRSKIVRVPAECDTEPPTDHAQGQRETARMSLGPPLKRVFDIDIEHCPNCGALKIIAAIEDPLLIVKIRRHLGRPALRCVRRRVESIYFKRSEEPKTACQRKP
jgi:hypothetical protein